MIREYKQKITNDIIYSIKNVGKNIYEEMPEHHSNILQTCSKLINKYNSKVKVIDKLLSKLNIVTRSMRNMQSIRRIKKQFKTAAGTEMSYFYKLKTSSMQAESKRKHQTNKSVKKPTSKKPPELK